MVIKVNISDLTTQPIAALLLPDEFKIGTWMDKKRIDGNWLVYDFHDKGREEAILQVLKGKKIRATLHAAKPGKETKADRIKTLAKQITAAKDAYYKTGTSPLTDAEYDALEAELKQLDPRNPVLKKVGTTSGGTVVHDPPMLSAEKAHDVDAVVKWAANQGQKILVWGFKIDGVSLELEYKNGKLLRASTRGDGHEGEDVTMQAGHVIGVKKSIRLKDVKIRGEVYITKDDFEVINSTLDEKDAYTSPRNLAAGTLKLSDPGAIASRRLRFIAWDLIPATPVTRGEFIDKVTLLRETGFQTADQSLVKANKIREIFAKYTRERNDFPFEMDGLVFKINDIPTQNRVGSTEHHPRWIMALKFPAAEHETKITGITWQVSRNGRLTPVAELAPVTIGGATITRATLNNAGFVEKLDIAAGDMASIVRAGDVIPKIVSTRKVGGSASAKIPRSCPACGSKTKREGLFLQCTNLQCGDAAIRNILHFVKAAGIEGIGEGSAKQLYVKRAVMHPSDLFLLDAGQLGTLLESKAIGTKVHASIQSCKTLPINKFLHGLNIKNLGNTASMKIAAEASKVEEVTPKLVNRLFGEGSVIANDINAGLALKPWVPYFKAGVKVRPARSRNAPVPAQAGSAIAGKRIYVTGKVPGMDKEQVRQHLERLGAIWTSGLSKNLDYVVTGEGVKENNAKVANAKELKIPVLTWEKLLDLLSR